MNKEDEYDRVFKMVHGITAAYTTAEGHAQLTSITECLSCIPMTLWPELFALVGRSMAWALDVSANTEPQQKAV